MKINRVWAMPDKNTFKIKAVKKLIQKYSFTGQFGAEVMSIDPFANTNRLAKICNDIDPQHNTEYCMDAKDFLRMIDGGIADMILFDPPYSPRQVSECYKQMGRVVDMQTTQASFWSDLKKEIARIIKPGGIVISCGWNSGGIGKSHGFEIKEVLMVTHGGWHNDTIVTVERCMQEKLGR